ncbi:MAG: DUF1700 domain-containing protein [Lachnospiraceae bacterium]|nr:DUF1700 domain-containing protein [Lachnospiraceae bacterium]
MNKELFLQTLRERLSFLPQRDIEERISFYEEMIDDRIEEGLSEEEAVAAVGSVDDIVEQVMAEIPLSKLVVQKVKPKRSIRTWEIVLLILGFPVWFPLIIAFAAVMFSVWIVLWALVITVFAVGVSFVAGWISTLPVALYYVTRGSFAGAGSFLGAGMILAGLGILVFIGGKYFGKGVIIITKKYLLWIKSLFVGKEG